MGRGNRSCHIFTPFAVVALFAFVFSLSSLGFCAVEESTPAETPSAHRSADLFTVEIPRDRFQETLPTIDLLKKMRGEEKLFVLREKEKKTVVSDKDEADVNTSGLVLWTILILALIVGGCLLLKKFFPNNKFMAGGGAITIVSRKQLTSKHSLFLVEVSGKVFLIGVTKDAIQTIGDFTDSETVSALKTMSPARQVESMDATFKDRLKECVEEGEGGVDEREKEKLEGLFDEIAHIKSTVSKWRGSLD